MNHKYKFKVNKENPWSTCRESNQHMLERQEFHRSIGMTKAELWFYENYLKKSSYKWTKQARFGFRLFDFWNCKLGVAIEVDGTEHDKDYDKLRDDRDYKRSALVVYRVRNFNDNDAEIVMNNIYSIKLWNLRRVELGMKPRKDAEVNNL